MENNIIFNQVCAIIKKNRGELDKPLTGATQLQHDLGIDGSDAEEIMIEYFSSFDIDSTQFVFTDYFGEETFNPIAALKNIFKGIRRKQISINHLVKCVYSKTWVSPT